MPLADLSLVTSSLRTLMDLNMRRLMGGVPPGAISISTLPPEKVGAAQNTLNLHLYHIAEDRYYKNMPGPGNDARNIARAPMALALFYILTAHHEQNPDIDALTQQRLMGLALNNARLPDRRRSADDRCRRGGGSAGGAPSRVAGRRQSASDHPAAADPGRYARLLVDGRSADRAPVGLLRGARRHADPGSAGALPRHRAVDRRIRACLGVNDADGQPFDGAFHDPGGHRGRRAGRDRGTRAGSAQSRFGATERLRHAARQQIDEWDRAEPRVARRRLEPPHSAGQPRRARPCDEPGLGAELGRRPYRFPRPAKSRFY